jgi:hypothetical protein
MFRWCVISELLGTSFDEKLTCYQFFVFVNKSLIKHSTVLFTSQSFSVSVALLTSHLPSSSYFHRISPRVPRHDEVPISFTTNKTLSDSTDISCSSSPPYSVSKLEAELYYSGLPYNPVSGASTID